LTDSGSVGHLFPDRCSVR